MKNALIPGHDGRYTSPLTDHLTTSNFGTTNADNVAGNFLLKATNLTESNAPVTGT